MRSINIGVVTKHADGKIPVDVAGNVMVNVQTLFRHIGEYLIMQELKLLNRIDEELSDIFSLYIDPSSGISLRSSTKISTSGIIDNALALLENTLVKTVPGTGTQWINDTYEDPRFKKIIAEDVIKLTNGLGRCHLKLGSDTLEKPDVGRIKKYLGDVKMFHDDVLCGVPRLSNPKSRRPDVKLIIGEDRIKATFADRESNLEAEVLVNKPVLVGGRVRYGGDRINEVTDIKKVILFDSVKFKRMLSSDGDIALTTPLEVKVGFDEAQNEWVLQNSGIGARVAKKDWDTAVKSFHDYFVFLWNEYTSGQHTDLSEEEEEVKAFLLELVVAK